MLKDQGTLASSSKRKQLGVREREDFKFKYLEALAG